MTPSPRRRPRAQRDEGQCFNKVGAAVVDRMRVTRRPGYSEVTDSPAFRIEALKEIAIATFLHGLGLGGVALNQQQISKLMGAIISLVDRRMHAVEHLVVGERSE